MTRPPTTVPRWVVALAALGAVFFAVPILGLLIDAPWRDLVSILTGSAVLEALGLSLVTSVAAAVVAAVIGVPLGVVLARVEFPGRRLVRALVTLPMVLPPVVGGVALLLAFGRRGVVGSILESVTGWTVPFTTVAVVLAAAFVATPFLVLTVEGAVRNLDGRHEAAAATLGADPGTVFRRVTLPMILPSLRAGLVLAWARALGEFGATVTFAGNLPGRTRTLPLAVFVELDTDRATAITMSLLLMAVSLVVLVSMREHWWGRR